MRKSRIAAIALVVMLCVLLIPSAAFAEGSADEVKECLADITKQVDAGTISNSEIEKQETDCFSAPSPILPEKNEMVWGTLAFLIVAGGLIKFGFPMVKKGLVAREDKIREDLAAAESSKQEAAAKSQEYDDKLKDARAESARIIDEAKAQAAEVKADLVAKAEDEAAQIRAKAHADAESVASRALDDIQSQVAELSVDLAEKVVKASLDKKAQLDLVNGYIAELAK
jgi:F-type H+-transporting ATPase subunit b